jgi:membrane fusion protein
VRGLVVTTAPSAKILASRPGTLERVYVRDGDWVERGAPLAVVGVDTRAAARRGAAHEALDALESQRASLTRQLATTDEALLHSRRRLTEARASNAKEQAVLQRQVDLQAMIVRAKSEELARIAPIVERGFISRLEADRRRQALLLEEQRLEQQQQQLVQVHARRQDLDAQQRELAVNHERRTAELNGQLSALVQEQSRTRIEVSYSLVAPVSGYVTALQAAEGRNADPRIPLMVLTPKAARFAVELLAPSKAVGFLRAGQEVRISYDAFPYKQFGTARGRIVNVSHSTYAPGELDVPLQANEPVYRVAVSLDEDAGAGRARSLPLQSGMTLNANVILERRSFVDWLLQPLNAVRKRT